LYNCKHIQQYDNVALKTQNQNGRTLKLINILSTNKHYYNLLLFTGQADVDCLNDALCCFDGCANVCQGAGPIQQPAQPPTPARYLSICKLFTRELFLSSNLHSHPHLPGIKLSVSCLPGSWSYPATCTATYICQVWIYLTVRCLPESWSYPAACLATHTCQVWIYLSVRCFPGSWTYPATCTATHSCLVCIHLTVRCLLGKK
jgi:hypothetical protein